MTDLHDRVARWLAEAAPGDPPRDLALHASGCGECITRASALDALAEVDPGRAPEPPLHVAGPTNPAGLLPLARAVAGMAAMGLLAAAVFVGAGTLIGDRSPAGSGFRPEPSNTPAEGVLGAAASDAATATPSPSARESASASPSASATPTADASPDGVAETDPAASSAPALPAPTTIALPAGTPRPSAPASTPAPAPAPDPTSAPTPTPPPPTPAPTPTPPPTPPPTPAPPPDPTPSPTPTPADGESAASDDSCTNAVDDDEDLLIDILDPGCLTGSSEFDA